MKRRPQIFGQESAKSISFEAALFTVGCAVFAGIGIGIFSSPLPSDAAKGQRGSSTSAVTPTQLTQRATTFDRIVNPTFDCTNVVSDVLKLICVTPQLARLDRDLADAYIAALAMTRSPSSIRADQRAWIRARNNGRADVQTITSLYARRISELRATADPSLDAAFQAPMTFVYHGNTNFVEAMDLDFRIIDAEGEIGQGTASHFAALLAANKVTPGATVVFNSPGGLVAEAMKLGAEIRGAGLNTSVKSLSFGPDRKINGPISGCFSSCALAFLGGVERTVPSNAALGVHQLSIGTPLSSTEAMEFGQSAVGDIAVYASEMGAKAEFVYQMTRAAPERINLLSPAQLHELNVTTPEFQTEWEIRSDEGRFYLASITTMRRGLDRMGLNCGTSEPEMVFIYDVGGKYLHDVLGYTTDYGFEFDGSHMDLLPSEILQSVRKLDDNHVVATIALSPRILDQLQTARTITFEMMPPSHISYAGWTMDFTSGRDKFFEFLKACPTPSIKIDNPESQAQ
jgi:uncharacterized protein YecT (DUF1311 family)